MRALLLGRVVMRTVITYGTFDLFHVGHVNLLRRARLLGERLIVAVSTDKFNAEKGKRAFFSYQDRSEILEACRYVDLVIPEVSWDQKRSDIANHSVDIFVMGDDWLGKFDFLSELCEVQYLPRTEGISSSLVKDTLAGSTGSGEYVDAGQG